ncbi:MAG: YebC/PmpR family DNA-binding transcriptional regulator, partial [Microscillaceae bacterium]|nr:YebC/PmpR family DNA-binding transcriptional regulator [Microscillaceae bacterium]MDW8459744.1 YebC/PmpR family DNA-binding transcriptional regulator [Cytophagales bacterium]
KEQFGKIQKALEQQNLEAEEASLIRLPQTWVRVTDPETLKNIEKLIDLLEEDDDVQRVYHNLETATQEA